MDARNPRREELRREQYFAQSLNRDESMFYYSNSKPGIEVFNMEDCHFVSKFLQQKSSSLSLVSFFGVEVVDNDGWVVLARALQQLKSLQIVRFSYNGMTIAGCRALSTAVVQQKSLLALDLVSNNIGDNECSNIAKIIQQNRSMLRINLRNNQIGDTGCRALAQALKENRTLVRLDIRNNNNISEHGLMEFTNILFRHNTTLCQIDYDHHAKPNKLDFYLTLNKMGRKDFWESSNKAAILNTRRKNLTKEEATGALYYFLRSKPDIWCQRKKKDEGKRKKRKIR